MVTIAADREIKSDISGVRFKSHTGHKLEPTIDNLIKAYEFTLKKELSARTSSLVVQPVAPKQVKERYILRRGPCIFIDECLDKLVILRTMMVEKVDSKWYKEIKYRPPELRFTSEDDEEFALYKYTNNRKLTKDICVIHNLLNTALEGFERSRAIGEFLESISALEQESQDVIELCNDFEDNLRLLEKLNYDMCDSYRKNQQKYTKKLDAIYRLNQTYEDLVLYSRVEHKYVNRWEDDRCYLNDFLNNDRIQALKNIIQEYTDKIICENRIHDEICTYLHQTTGSNADNIDEWMENYDKELERYEGEIFEVKVDRERWETDFGLLKKEYESRSADMAHWLQLKEEMKRKAELDVLLNANAVRIQAWWRGVMVRRHLGPFRKKKKGQKGKDKKGKKKK